MLLTAAASLPGCFSCPLTNHGSCPRLSLGLISFFLCDFSLLFLGFSFYPYVGFHVWGHVWVLGPVNRLVHEGSDPDLGLEKWGNFYSFAHLLASPAPSQNPWFLADSYLTHWECWPPDRTSLNICISHFNFSLHSHLFFLLSCLRGGRVLSTLTSMLWSRLFSCIPGPLLHHCSSSLRGKYLLLNMALDVRSVLGIFHVWDPLRPTQLPESYAQGRTLVCRPFSLTHETPIAPLMYCLQNEAWISQLTIQCSWLSGVNLSFQPCCSVLYPWLSLVKSGCLPRSLKSLGICLLCPCAPSAQSFPSASTCSRPASSWKVLVHIPSPLWNILW